MSRCFGEGDPLYADYHDHEWGRPVTGEAPLFELVCLEGFQAGLSWRVVLGRREALRAAFAGFSPDAVAAFDDADVDRLMGLPGVIRHRAKVEAAVGNALATVALRAEGGLPALLWGFRPGANVRRQGAQGETVGADRPRPAPLSWSEVPSETPESRALAKELRRRGFRFVGPTTAYALMQAAGIVNDHLAGCPVRAEADEQAVRRRPAPDAKPAW